MSRLPDPVLAGGAQEAADGVKDNDIGAPRKTKEDVVDVSLDMPGGVDETGFQVTGPRVVTAAFEGLLDDLRALHADEDVH
jgi:hypothetical protein